MNKDTIKMIFGALDEISLECRISGQQDICKIEQIGLVGKDSSPIFYTLNDEVVTLDSVEVTDIKITDDIRPFAAKKEFWLKISTKIIENNLDNKIIINTINNLIKINTFEHVTVYSAVVKLNGYSYLTSDTNGYIVSIDSADNFYFISEDSKEVYFIWYDDIRKHSYVRNVKYLYEAIYYYYVENNM